MDDVKMIYGIVGLLLASGLLTYLTQKLNPASENEFLREKNHNKKRQSKSEFQLLSDQDTARFLD